VSTSHMSKTDMATMRRCQAMSHDMMMKDSKCMKMMKMHPGHDDQQRADGPLALTLQAKPRTEVERRFGCGSSGHG